jgi:hypothetical protein
LGAKDQRAVHRLVAEAFIPNPLNLPMVHHINSVKTDNRVENLMWCTAKFNVSEAVKDGLWKPRKGATHSGVKLTELQVREIFRLAKLKCNQYIVASLFDTSQDQVSNILRGKRWEHLGLNDGLQ